MSIGNIQFGGGGKEVVRAGSTLTNRPRPRTHAKAKQQQQHASKTPAVPLVVLSAVFDCPLSLSSISKEATQESTHPLRKALFDLLKKYHSEDGLPVVLVVPRKVSHGKSTLLQLTPYKVPPRSEILKQLWEEIKEKFGKTVQGLSTKNGAVDWFRGVWEKFKEEIMSRGWVSVGSSPFPVKKEKPSVLSYLLSAKQLLTKQTEPPEKKDEKEDNHSNKTVLSGAELAEIMGLFQAHPDKKISELLPYMPERARLVLNEFKRKLGKHLPHLSKLKAKGELPPLLQDLAGFVKFLDARFPRLLDPPVIFRRLFDVILRHYEKIYGPDPLFLELRRIGSFYEFVETVYLQEKRRAPETPEPKREPKKLRLPPSKVIEDVVKFFEGRRSQVSRQELETAIYAAWQKEDKDKADRLAVSRYIDRYEGVLWRKLNNGHYGLLVSSDEVRVRIRDYVRELKQAKNGQGQTSADGNGSLGSQSSNGNNGNGKYDIDHIIHTLEEKGSVVVPPQFVHEIARELRRRGFSVIYWASGLIELVGGDDELPF